MRAVDAATAYSFFHVLKFFNRLVRLRTHSCFLFLAAISGQLSFCTVSNDHKRVAPELFSLGYVSEQRAFIPVC